MTVTVSGSRKHYIRIQIQRTGKDFRKSSVQRLNHIVRSEFGSQMTQTLSCSTPTTSFCTAVSSCSLWVSASSPSWLQSWTVSSELWSQLSFSFKAFSRPASSCSLYLRQPWHNNYVTLKQCRPLEVETCAMYNIVTHLRQQKSRHRRVHTKPERSCITHSCWIQESSSSVTLSTKPCSCAWGRAY